MESRNYTFISEKDVQETIKNPRSKSLEDLLENSLKKLPGTIGDSKFHANLILLEEVTGTEDFIRLQALTKERYEALVALERNKEEGAGREAALALWEAYRGKRNNILKYAANGARHSLGQFPIRENSDITVGDVIREADFRLQQYAENGFKQATGAELAELLMFQRNEKNLSLAQWFKKVFNTIFVKEPRQAVEFKQLPPLEIPATFRGVELFEVKKPQEPVAALQKSDEAFAHRLYQQDLEEQEARRKALEREGLASPVPVFDSKEANQEEVRLQRELLAYYESLSEKKKAKCELAEVSESQEPQVSSSEAKVMQLLRGDRGVAVDLQLKAYEEIGPEQASKVAELKEDTKRYQLAAHVQQQELDFYKQEMENLKLTQDLLDEEEKGYRLRR